MVWHLCFVLLPNYPLYHGEEAEIFITQFLIQGKERLFEMPPVVHFVLAAEFCTSPCLLYFLVEQSRPKTWGLPHYLLRPASWIKLRKDHLFKCNFDIRLAKKILCSGFSDTILISLVILAKKVMKVSFFHRRAWVELKIVQFRGDLLYNIWNR